MPSAVYHILIQIAGSQTHLGKDILGLPMLFDAANFKSYILPVISLSIGNIAYYAMWLRRYMVDESNKDYIRLARAKGVPSTRISFGHVFRNAFVPMIQYIPTSLMYTVCGSIYIESLYSIPGMGGLLALELWTTLNGTEHFTGMVLLSVVILLSGLVATARLRLERHTFGQVMAGLLLGFAVCFLTVTLFA